MCINDIYIINKAKDNIVDFNLLTSLKRRKEFYFLSSRLTTQAAPPHFSNKSLVISVGFCAACGCSDPLYTFKCLNTSRPILFFGNMPLIAFSTMRSGNLSCK